MYRQSSHQISHKLYMYQTVFVNPHLNFNEKNVTSMGTLRFCNIQDVYLF